jgi:hypothetical protein
MATITSTNLQNLADNCAKIIADTYAAFVTGPSTNAPTIATITSGITGASNSLESRIAGLADFSQESTLATAAAAAATNMNALLNNQITQATIEAQFAAYMNALDLETSGLASFLSANSIQVDEYFSGAFNYFVSNAVALGLRGNSNLPTKIPTTSIFPHASQANLGSIAVTGAAAGAFTAGTAIDTTKYSPLTLYIENTSAGNAAAATSFTVTYTGSDGTSHTVTFAISSGMQPGVSHGVSLSVIGSAVTNIAVNSSGTSGESYQIYAPVVRSVAY